MKKSNIVFISFLSVCFLLMVAAALDLRLFGKRKFQPWMNLDNPFKKVIALPAVHYLRIVNCSYLKVVTSDSSRLVYFDVNDSVISKITYELKGDTMVISNIPHLQNHESIVLFSPVKLKSIYSIHSSISLSCLMDSSMNVVLVDSHLYDWDTGDQLLVQMNINAKKSKVDFNNYRLKGVNLILNHSQLDFKKKINKIYGELRDSSALNCQNFDEIKVSKDTSCWFTSDNY
jgi:hypothetical protein